MAANVFTHSVGVLYKNDSGTITSTTHTYTDDSEIGLDGVVAAGATNKEFDVAFTLTKVISLVLFSDQALTLKTNSTSSPQDTIAIAAGKEIIFTFDGQAGGADPFAGNITKFYFSNAGTKDANVKFRALLHEGV
jgi:hypothetical protein